MTSSPAAPTTVPALPVASTQDGTYPRPQRMRGAWADLDGEWEFRHDDDDRGRGEGWPAGFSGGPRIRVPFPPESPASGIDAPAFHPVVWYSRTIDDDDLIRAGRTTDAARLLLHFGAVDYRADVWIDGRYVGGHEGGHTPFTLDVTAELTPGEAHVLVVRAEDDPLDATQPRGKQDWHEKPHAIWYERTTGIWQTVWLEAVPRASIDHLSWLPAGPEAMELTVRIRGTAPADARLRIDLRFTERDESLGSVTATLPSGAPSVRVIVPVQRQRNGQAQDELTWSPEHPRLVDAVISLRAADDTPLDAVSSYFGMRTVGVARGAFLLNGLPYDVRSVLNQGYWPDSHLTAPSREALRREVELIKELGFTACRIHQKIEDPRFLYWADRLGILVWGEAPGAYEFSQVAVQRLTREWMEAIDRDAGHPSIVTWVPFNESWGIQHVATDRGQQAYSRALTDLTRALDPTRPVVSNDGWEQQNTDILTIHDYEGDGAVLAQTYSDDAARKGLVSRLGPAGRRLFVGDAEYAGQPIMLTEFGGVNYQPGDARPDAWGYTTAADGDDWLTRIDALYAATRASGFLAGTCYTQLTDTMQETNGLLNADRTPKMRIEAIRRAVTGRD